MTPTGAEIVKRRHPEWQEHQLRWRWLADSLEGGDRYRWAVYGTDPKGLPARNLIRHKREYPDPRDTAAYVDPSFLSMGVAPPTDDDFVLRLVRTPVPDFVSEAVRKNLGRIYRHEVKREGPAGYMAWADDADGTGLKADQWMRQRVAPLLLACGQLDIVVDHPPAPEGERIDTRADAAAAGLDAVVARVVMPWETVWWRLGRDGRYAETLVRELAELPDGKTEERFRHWTAKGWTLYDGRGEPKGQGTHAYGIVPMCRVFLGRKPRCQNVGQTSMEVVAELQREAYNRDSELVLSDVLQAHPVLQGPPEDTSSDGTVPVGPNLMLLKRRDSMGGNISYEGYEYVEPPKGAADSIRANLDRLRDSVDRSQALAKPAGAEGGSVVAQSGLSKSFDHAERNDLLSEIADALQEAEEEIGRVVSIVAGDGAGPTEPVIVSYSRQFDLTDPSEIADAITTLQEFVASAGRLPEIEAELGMQYLMERFPGRDEATYEAWRKELAAAIGKAGAEREQQLKLEAQAAMAGNDPMNGATY